MTIVRTENLSQSEEVTTDRLDRMRLVLAWRGWSEREWARRAGLKEESHVTQILRRLKANPTASVDTNVFAALAVGHLPSV